MAQQFHFTAETFEMFYLLLQAAADSRFVYGFMGKRVEGGGYTMNVPGKPGVQYVRIVRGGNELVIDECVNFGSNPNPNLLVRMERRNGRLVVIHPDASHALELYGAAVSSASVPPHLSSVGSGIAEPVEDRRFLPGLVSPSVSGGLNVRVEAYMYDFGAKDEVDPFAVTPTATVGKKAFIGIYADSDGVLQEVLGVDHDSFQDNSELTREQAIADLVFPDGSSPLAAVLVNESDTTIDGNTLIHDLRMHFARKLNYNGAGIIITAAADYILIQDQKAQNTAGGAFTSGAWQTRVLNTEVTDTGDHASVASNQITLQPGTYQAYIICPGVSVDRHQSRLQNITDATTTLLGTSVYNASATLHSGVSVISGRFTITSPKVFEVQHRCQTTKATNGFGVESNFTTEVYTSALFLREKEGSAEVVTNDDTPTSILTYATSTDKSYSLEGTITARRTGGSAGAAGDGATYKIVASFKNTGGTLTERTGSPTLLVEIEDNTDWDVVSDISGTDYSVQVVGDTDNDINWQMAYVIHEL